MVHPAPPHRAIILACWSQRSGLGECLLERLPGFHDVLAAELAKGCKDLFGEVEGGCHEPLSLQSIPDRYQATCDGFGFQVGVCETAVLSVAEDVRESLDCRLAVTDEVGVGGVFGFLSSCAEVSHETHLPHVLCGHAQSSPT